MTINESKQPLPEEAKMLAADYVLGELTPDEEARLERMAAGDPALQKEINALQTTLALVPQSLPIVAPPASLKDKIVISAESSVANSVENVAETPSAIRQKTQGVKQQGQKKQGQKKQGQTSIAKLLAGIAALTALVLGVDNFRLRNQLQLAQKVDPNQVAAILSQPNSRLISLKSTENPSDGSNAETAAGTLLFTPGNWQEVIVSLGNLPPLPPEEVYRMWLALENGEVIYCGAFNADDTGSVYVRFTPPETPPKGIKTTALYVTVDKDGPTPDPSGPRVMEGSI